MGLSDEDAEKAARVYFQQMENNLDQIIKGDER